MIQLPDAFQKKMKTLLGNACNEFFQSYEEERVHGLRVNPLKTNVARFAADCPFLLEHIPWCQEGYYYQPEERPGKHPYHEAGVYYIQEPSAMAVTELLNPEPGDLILDLCAAPGGKTTHIAGRMNGQGLLVSNETHPARVKILAQNVERMGITNAVVTNESAVRLAERFPGFFDKIVVDAPCSGEGMFRKDPQARDEWSPDRVAACAARQKELLCCAAAMLKEGGRLVYSTCTFSPEEDEQVIEAFIDGHAEFTIEERGKWDGISCGRPEWGLNHNQKLCGTYRIWPHLAGGEGHYLAVLKNAGRGEESRFEPPVYEKDRTVLRDFRAFTEKTLLKTWRFADRNEYLLFGSQLYLVPPQLPKISGLKVTRPGLHLGMLKKNRFEPSHALALSLKKEETRTWYELGGGEEVFRYLRGETIATRGMQEKGWILMVIDGYSIGFGKLATGVIKNHYPKGLRWM